MGMEVVGEGMDVFGGCWRGYERGGVIKRSRELEWMRKGWMEI